MKKIKLPRLHLYLVLDLGFFGFRTSAMYHSHERDVFEVVSLHWFLFKWKGQFRLYSNPRGMHING